MYTLACTARDIDKKRVLVPGKISYSARHTFNKQKINMKHQRENDVGREKKKKRVKKKKKKEILP